MYWGVNTEMLLFVYTAHVVPHLALLSQVRMVYDIASIRIYVSYIQALKNKMLFRDGAVKQLALALFDSIH